MPMTMRYSPPHLCHDGGIRAIAEIAADNYVSLVRLAVAHIYADALIYLNEIINADALRESTDDFRWATFDDLDDCIPKSESTDGHIAYYRFSEIFAAREGHDA